MEVPTDVLETIVEPSYNPMGSGVMPISACKRRSLGSAVGAPRIAPGEPSARSRE